VVSNAWVYLVRVWASIDIAQNAYTVLRFGSAKIGLRSLFDRIDFLFP